MLDLTPDFSVTLRVERGEEVRFSNMRDQPGLSMKGRMRKDCTYNLANESRSRPPS
jgi:hypothetical protein